MRKMIWSSRTGAARANPAIGLLLLGAVVAIIVTLLNRESGSERDARTGANYLEQARGASAIDPELIAWEESIEPIDVPMDFPVAIAVASDAKRGSHPAWIYVAGDRLLRLNPDRSAPSDLMFSDSRSEPVDEPYRGIAVYNNELVVAITAYGMDLFGFSSEAGVEPSCRKNTGWSYSPEWTDVGFSAVEIQEGVAYVADALSRRVFRHQIIPHKDEPEVQAEGFNVPSTMDLTVNADGELVTVDPGRHLVQVRDAYGDVVRSFGENGTRIDQFHGCCNPIAIALLSDGRWVTGEKGLGVTRVKVYSADGEFESVVAGPDAFDEPKSGPPIVIDVAVDSKDRILVLDPVRKQVRTFTPKEDSR